MGDGLNVLLLSVYRAQRGESGRRVVAAGVVDGQRSGSRDVN